MIRVAAVGDIHYDHDSQGRLGPLEALERRADVLLLAGDLTRRGDPDEAAVLASDLRGARVPVLAVLGNHDYHQDRQSEVAAVLADAGVQVLEGDAAVLQIDGESVGVAGVKGFGGGFAGACATEFGEQEMKLFVRLARDAAERLHTTLNGLQTQRRIALLHYSPIQETLVGEPPPLWPFLGSYLLGEAIDTAAVDLVLHGHAHGGSHQGRTPGGVPVRNVAQAVIRRAYDLYHLGASEAAAVAE